MKFIRLKTAYSSSAGKQVKVSHLLLDLSNEEVGAPSYYQEFTPVGMEKNFSRVPCHLVTYLSLDEQTMINVLLYTRLLLSM